MKKVFVFVMLTAVAAFVLSSCKETLPKRFDKFVDQVEKKAEKFTEEDWNKANTQFEKLVDEFQQNKDSYTAEEQKQITSDIGKYIGLVAKSGFDTVINAVNGFMDQIPSLLQSIGEGIGGFLKGLGLEEEPTE